MKYEFSCAFMSILNHKLLFLQIWHCNDRHVHEEIATLSCDVNKWYIQ